MRYENLEINSDRADSARIAREARRERSYREAEPVIGADGELIPMHEVKPARLRHVPSMRYRGWVSEGTEFQQSMVEAVELAPKLGMNVFMIEFKFPRSYYERYYNHDHNPYRAAEPVSMNTKSGETVKIKQSK